MTQESLYWLFSTIAQTYGAIVGIIGMLTVYRLQTLSNQIENSRKNSEESVKVLVGLDVSLLEAEDLVEVWRNKTQDERKILKQPRADIIDREVKKIIRCIKWKKI